MLEFISKLNKIKEQLKQAWKSWTIWFNVTGIVLLELVLSDALVLDYLTDKDLVVVILVGNMILRFKTGKGLEQK